MSRDGHLSRVDGDDREIAAGLTRLVADEPPFTVSLPVALEAAERSGRRRRRARAAAAGGLAAGVGLAGAGAVLASAGPFAARGDAGSVIASASTQARAPSPPPAALPQPAPSPVGGPPATLRQLEELALAVAAPAGGRASVVRREDIGKGPFVLVNVDRGTAGAFNVHAAISPGPTDSPADWSCAFDRHALDPRVYQPLAATPQECVWARTYPTQPARKSLLLAAATATGATLTVFVDNNDTSADATQVRPTWEEAGITTQGVLAAARDSELG